MVEGATYYYRAVDGAGELCTGQIEAASAAAAARALSQRGHRPLRVQTSPVKQSLLQREIGLTRSRRLSLADARGFSRDMAIMLGSGLELHRAVDLVGTTWPEQAALAGFTRAVHTGLSHGRGLAEAVASSGYAVPADFIAVLAAAERSGGLAGAFGMLAQSYGQRIDLRQKLIAAAAYPAFLVVVALAALAIIAIFVAPSLAGLFASLGRPMPPIVQILVDLPVNLARHGVALALATGLAFGLLVTLSRVPQARDGAKTVIFGVPMVGPLFVWAATSRFAGMLNLAVLNNIPIAEAASSSWQTSGFPRARQAAAALADGLRRGQRLPEVAERLTGLPPSVMRLLAAGDATNRLPQVLLTIVEEADRQVAYRATLMTNLMAPVLIVLVGSLVGTIIFGVFSALLEITQLTY